MFLITLLSLSYLLTIIWIVTIIVTLFTPLTYFCTFLVALLLWFVSSHDRCFCSKFRRDDPMDITMDDDDDDEDNDDDDGDNNSDDDMVIMEEGAEADSLDGTQDAKDWDGII